MSDVVLRRGKKPGQAINGVKPQLIMGGYAGFHNEHGAETRKRLRAGQGYRDLSTVIVVPTRGMIPARTVESWLGLMTPMNQKAHRMFVSGMEVGEAYNMAVETILNHSMKDENGNEVGLKTFKYMLTLEEDNLPPPDGLLKLIESISKGTFSVIGGLYWTKFEGGQPMIYGDPKKILAFAPQVPKADTVQECNGLGMGFTLFDLDIFRAEKLTRPWFKTVQEWEPSKGGRGYTQDLFFFENARKAGYRVACDTRVKVGHLDVASGFVW